jgi:hypothetical protein
MDAFSTLAADERDLAAFHAALFTHADPAGFIAVRAFHEGPGGRGKPAFRLASVPIGDAVRTVLAVDEAAANEGVSVVVAPPVCTFSNPAGANETDIAEGVALSVDCDATDPQAALVRLTDLLGKPTVVVASGGDWTDPDSGEVFERLHLHWRLAVPTRDLAGHRQLKRARELAALVVGGDRSAGPVNHPLRWPGTRHTKQIPHRLARIDQLDRMAEIDLNASLAALEAAAGDARGAPQNPPTGILGVPERRLKADDALRVVGALACIPNADADWGTWNKVGLATFAASAGNASGYAAWLAWSEKSAKHDAAECAARWEHYNRHAGRNADTDPEARRVGAGTLVYLADQAAPGWRQPAEPVKATVGATLTALDIDAFRLDRMTEGEPPPQQFLLEPIMPLGVVGLLFGEGGLGKSMAALDLALTVAQASRGSLLQSLPGPLGGIVPAASGGASIFLTLEDDAGELHRRANALDRQRDRDGLPCYVIPGIELPGFDPALVTTDRGRVSVLTDLARTDLPQLIGNVSQAAGVPVRLLILDPAGDFLAADENDAGPVKLLMRTMRELARAHGCTVLLLGHVAKGGGGQSMRGSGAWVANARFAVGMRRPEKSADANAIALFKRAGIDPSGVVICCLTKANHAGAPVGKDRFFVRQEASGRLRDETARLAPSEPDHTLLAELERACAAAAEAEHPFKLTGPTGLYAGRADLPDVLAGLSRHKLEALGNRAVELRRLVKCTAPGSKVPDVLDVPAGPYATSCAGPTFTGSRAEALAQGRAGTRANT